MHWRIVRCPAGYELKRDPLFPDQDDCVRCTEGFYLLKPVRWFGPKFPNFSLPICHPCPTSATCAGGSDVQAKAGYWKLSWQFLNDFEFIPDAPCSVEDEICMFPNSPGLGLSQWGEEMTCRRLDTSERLYCARPYERTENEDNPRAEIFICPLNACDDNNTCSQNRTGAFSSIAYSSPLPPLSVKASLSLPCLPIILKC